VLHTIYNSFANRFSGQNAICTELDTPSFKVLDNSIKIIIKIGITLLLIDILTLL